jgi:hypothetical protein
MISFEDFKKEYIKRGICLGQMSIPKHTLNERELSTRYEKYVKAQNKKNTKVGKGTFEDPLWIEVSTTVHKRDKEQCRFLSKLKVDNPELYVYFIENNLSSLYTKLDLAHIIPRSDSKALYYEPENLILLNRVSHSLIDMYHDPVTGKPITKQQREDYFRYIIGNELYEDLLKRK